MSGSLYRLADSEVLAIGLNRLADIDAQIALGDDLDVWFAERDAQVRLLGSIERRVAA